MKTVSAAYIAKEEALTRRPVEIYHIWRDGGEHWYYTSGDVAITYDSNSYVPVSISRTMTQYEQQLEVTSIKVTLDYLNDIAADFITINPVEILWISVMKLHRDQAPLEADVVFIGQIKNIKFKGVKAAVDCVGFEQFLKKTIPQWRYQLTCNHTVFDDHCGLTKATYKVTETITLDATKTILTGTDFGLYADGYFVGGEVVFGVEKRPIVYHIGTIIYMGYQMNDLVSTDDVDVYPGCNGRLEICRDTFDNIVNSLAFPFIPEENPAERITW